MPLRRMRAVKEDVEHYLANVEKIFGTVAAGDDGRLFAVTWALAQETDWSRYPVIANTTHGPLRALKTVGSKKFPSITVFFTVSQDDETVWLHDVSL